VENRWSSARQNYSRNDEFNSFTIPSVSVTLVMLEGDCGFCLISMHDGVMRAAIRPRYQSSRENTLMAYYAEEGAAPAFMAMVIRNFEFSARVSKSSGSVSRVP